MLAVVVAYCNCIIYIYQKDRESLVSRSLEISLKLVRFKNFIINPLFTPPLIYILNRNYFKYINDIFYD